MNKQTYIKELQKALQNGNEADQEDIIRYVTEYFEDAEDDEQVLKELGTPQEFLANIQKDQAEQIETKTEEITEMNDNGIQRISICVDLGDVKIEKGKELQFQAIGVPEKEYKTYTAQNTLYIQSTYRFHFRISRNSIRYLYRLTVPENMWLTFMEIECKLGNVVLSDINVKELQIKEHLGDIRLTRVNCDKMKLIQKMGEIDYVGDHPGDMVLKNAMGSIDVTIHDDETHYNYDCSAAMGSVKINGDTCEGINTSLKRTHKDATYSIEAKNRMGDIKLRFQK